MPVTEQTFSDIIRGMQHAVNTAQAMLDEHQLWRFGSLFVDGQPRTMDITGPDGRQLRIPQISLMPLNLLAIEELELEFSIAVNSSDVTEIGVENIALERSSFGVEFAKGGGGEEGGGSTIDVRILFKQREEPEGFARVKATFDKSI